MKQKDQPKTYLPAHPPCFSDANHRRTVAQGPFRLAIPSSRGRRRRAYMKLFTDFFSCKKEKVFLVKKRGHR